MNVKRSTAPVATAALSSSAYAHKLVSANLDTERARAARLVREARAEQAASPRQAAKQLATAAARLAAIDAEQAARAKLAGAQALTQGLTSATGAALAAQQVSLGQSASPQAQLELLAVNRELDRREAQATAQRQQLEGSRLDQVKRQLVQSLQGKSPAELRHEQKAEHAQVGVAQRALELAREQLATARTPAARLSAQQVVTGAERGLRTEYARAAAIDHLAPVQLDHRALHEYADALKQQAPDALRAERARVSARLDQGHSGAIQRSREEQAMDRVQLAIVDQAIARAAPVARVDATRNPGNAVFDGPGMFIADATAYSPAQQAQKLKDAGVTWVSLQVNNGGPVEKNLAALQNGWADAFRAAGIKVGFWGVSYTDPARDAQDAARLTAQYRGDFYIADCEGGFQAGEGDVSRNRTFVDAFSTEATSQGIGNIPRALSSMGRVALDMKPWLDGGWDAMPQAYWNSYPVYQPTLCVKFYEDSGWPKGRIHPTIATYDGSHEGQAPPRQISDYAADLKAAGTTGFSYYLPESYLDDGQYQQLVDGLRNGMNGP